MSSNKIIVAIDGFSSCGKSTFAKKIASKLGYVFVDSGAMYRAVTLFAIKNSIVDSSQEIISSLADIKIDFTVDSSSGNSIICLNGELVGDSIRTMEVNENVSSVSSIAQVRDFVSSILQRMGESKGIVMDGRDIGTSVFPNAELKIFMTASSKVRAMRRFKELQTKNIDATLEEIEKNLNERDFIDQNRKESPLRKADDAVVLDNSNMSVEEQLVWVEELINNILDHDN